MAELAAKPLSGQVAASTACRWGDLTAHGKRGTLKAVHSAEAKPVRVLQIAFGESSLDG